MKSLPSFEPGQAWMSEAEPELGIGFVRDQDFQSVALEFPVIGQTRRYGKRTSPLRRLEFRVGDSIQSVHGTRLIVERVETRGSLFWYLGSGQELCETEISPKLRLQRPLQRFLAGHWDPLSTFSLRRQALSLWHREQRSPAKGLIGPRAQLLPHQLYVVSQVSERALPRALLADEVGLGKTIQAGWILHRLSITGRARRVLIVVPGALVNQWFVEMFRRFNLSFWVPDSQSEELLQPEDFQTQERVILSLESLADLAEQGAFDATDWDLVIVDEAHRVEWEPEAPSREYLVLEKLAEKARGLLLLTATPEQLGLAGHFARLKLIDPVRFSSFEAFQAEYSRYREVVRLADGIASGKRLSVADKKALQQYLEGKVPDSVIEGASRAEGRRAVLSALIDFYGTGRVYFRNARQVVELEHCFFPKRTLKAYPLELNFEHAGISPGQNAGGLSEPLMRWLGEWGRAQKSRDPRCKTLLICSSAEQVIQIERKLRDEYGLKAVAFHEGLPLLARDRNAAYFEDPDGAAILVASEIGGEGRNFQHASHLILADLPRDPDVLEQRIGRLDRIGQTSDITLHVPFVRGSVEEKLLQWHDRVFHAFEAPAKGAGIVYQRYRSALDEALTQAQGSSSLDSTAFESLLQKASQDYAKTLKEIEAGRDRLIELHSFDPEEGARLAEMLTEAERSDELREFLESVFDGLGIHSEDLDADSLFVEPGDSMYASHFPALPLEGLRMTFSRRKALAREDLALMTWDHPMAIGALEAFASQEIGNVAVATWGAAPRGVTLPLLLVDCNCILETAPIDASWNADEFLAAEPIRVAMDATGQDLSETWSVERLQSMILPMPPEGARLARQLPPDRMRALLTKAIKQADTIAATLKAGAIEKMEQSIGGEIRRLEALRSQNGLVSEREITWWNERRTRLLKAYQGAKVRLDSFLLVMPSRLG